MNKQNKNLELKQNQQLERIIPIREVMHLTGLSKSTIYLYINRGEFPSAVRLGARRVGWRESEVQAWLRARVLESRNGLSDEWTKVVNN